MRHWVHTGLVNLSGRKMSKSAGNTQLVRELLREYSPDELRYYLLSWHYRDDMEFSEGRLKKASEAYARTAVKARSVSGPPKSAKKGGSPPIEEIRRLLSKFYSAMDDDLDTPKAIGWVEEELIQNRSADAASSYHALRIVSDVLGVDFLADP